MIFGHNTNVKFGTFTLHVQTEDRGEQHGLIDTTVYLKGRVLHRRTNNYYDLVPLDADREQALKLRLDEQHHAVIEEIHSGQLALTIPQEKPAEPESVAHTAAALQIEPQIEPVRDESIVPVRRQKYTLELMNAKSWLTAKHALLQVSVKDEAGDPVAGAKVTAHMDGAVDAQEFFGETGLYGQAQIEFEMPRIQSNEPALVIRAEDELGEGHLRFGMKLKTRVPAN